VRSVLPVVCSLILGAYLCPMVLAEGDPVTSEAQAESRVVADGAALELVAEGYKFTEGPAVDSEGKIFFTDQPNDRIMVCDLDGKVSTWMRPAGRSNGLFFDRSGRLIACADEKNQLWAISEDKSYEVLADGFDGKRFNGPNDVWCHPSGDLYFTDPFYRRPYWNDESREPEMPKRVYRRHHKTGKISIAADAFKQPNGIVGDPAGKVLYIADIGDKKTYRFRIDSNGELVERKLFCDMGSDGMTLDSAGNLYLTGKGVTVFSPSGKRIDHIAVPEGWTANVCVGGKQHRTLYITASDSLYSIQLAQ